MKTKVWISFDALPVVGGAASILAPAGCGSDVADVRDVAVLKQIFVNIKLDEIDERVSKVIALLQQHGVEFNSFTYPEYSDEDRQNARLLLVGPLDWFDEVLAGAPLGTKYDLTEACPHCETGAKQTSSLYVSHDDVPKIRKHRATRTVDGDILVDGGMVKKLKDAGVTGISFGDVRARLENGKWTSVARDQILVEHTMPPMRGERTARDNQYLCKVCRRGGRMVTPPKAYCDGDLLGIQDFNLTWEWFGEFLHENKGNRQITKRSSPNILVTPKVMNIFRDAGVTTFDWIPVDIEQ